MKTGNHNRPYRLKSWDYSSKGVYFITFCAHERKLLFGSIPNKGDNCFAKSEVELSELGRVCENAIVSTFAKLESARLIDHVVMPNHVHLLFAIEGDKSVDHVKADYVQSVVARIKMKVTYEARKRYPGMKVWRSSFHDHVIRDESDFSRIMEYIQNNPRKWELDRFHAD